MCTRHKRTPAPQIPYEVFIVPPYVAPEDDDSSLDTCEFYWPETVPGVTEKIPPADNVQRMGEQGTLPGIPEPDRTIDGRPSDTEPEELPTLVEKGEAPIYPPEIHPDMETGRTVTAGEQIFRPDRPGLWPTNEEQQEVFDRLTRTENDIDVFKKRCRALRNTDTREAWVVLDGILARMQLMIYGRVHEDDQ